MINLTWAALMNTLDDEARARVHRDIERVNRETDQMGPRVVGPDPALAAVLARMPVLGMNRG